MPASVRPWKELSVVRISNRPSSWPNLRASLNRPSFASAAAVAEEAFAGADEADQRLGQPSLRLVVVEIRDVDELARLLDQRLGDGGVRVAERGDGDAAAQIEVTPARDVVDDSCPSRG